MSNLLLDVVRIAKQAGAIILKYKDTPTLTKSDMSPVTQSDLKANEYICKELAHYQKPILSEESPDESERLESSLVWIIDPLDGTKNFVRKEESYCVMIGLVQEGVPILGVVYQPADKRCFFAKKGEGAFMQEGERAPEQIWVSNQQNNLRYVLSNMSLFKQYPPLKDQLHPKSIEVLGSVGVKIGRIALGKAECCFNAGKFLKEWDTCAPEIILQEAGGKMTDLFGNLLEYNKKDVSQRFGFLATNGVCHQEILSTLTRYARGVKGWKEE